MDGICILWFLLSKLEKLTYKYDNVLAIYVQTQPYHEIYEHEIEIYQINKFKNHIDER